MKQFALFIVTLCFIATVSAQSEDAHQRSSAKPTTSTYSAPAPAPATASYGAHTPLTIPSIPCPKNYLFSCQPSLTPSPCAPPPASVAGYGGGAIAGAYSQEYPVYTLPQFYNGYPAYY